MGEVARADPAGRVGPITAPVSRVRAVTRQLEPVNCIAAGNAGTLPRSGTDRRERGDRAACGRGGLFKRQANPFSS
jgi:hypothetical protein